LLFPFGRALGSFGFCYFTSFRKSIFSVGGQISIDIFPKHWNKTYCLQFIENMYESIYFFGDKVEIGGNDYEIYHHPSTISYQVFSPTDTIDILSKDFLNII
jgi:phosphomannomutase